MTRDTPTPAPRTGFIEANGLKVFYAEQGAGQPLLLLHGGSMTHTSWQWLATKAAAHFRVIAMDSRGHGQTDNPTGQFGFDLMTEDTAAVIKALALEKPLIMGYSDGGTIALRLAHRYPDLAKAVVVAGATHKVAASDHYFDGLAALFLTHSKGAVTADDFARFESEHPQIAARYAQLHKDWKKLLVQIWPTWTTRDVASAEMLARIKIPLLILLGDRDECFTVEDAVALQRAIAGSELAIIPGADHAMPRSRAELFNTVALDFLLRHAK